MKSKFHRSFVFKLPGILIVLVLASAFLFSAGCLRRQTAAPQAVVAEPKATVATDTTKENAEPVAGVSNKNGTFATPGAAGTIGHNKAVPQYAMEEKMPGGVPFQGLGADPLKAAAQDDDRNSTSKDWVVKKGPSVTNEGNEGSGSGDSTGPIQIGGGGFGTGANRGAGHGNQSDLGSQDMFGPPGGGGIGPRGPVFGSGGNARRIAFLCDASSSMERKMPTLKDQLSKTVVNLRPIQSFEIIFFQDKKFDSFIAFDHKDGLVPATPEAKRAAAKYLEGITAASVDHTDPLPGIIAAFKTKPQLIYLLTDGDFPDNDAVLKTVRDLYKALPAGEKVKINTIAFVGMGDNETAYLDLLKTIAKETGGTFRHVNESDL